MHAFPSWKKVCDFGLYNKADLTITGCYYQDPVLSCCSQYLWSESCFLALCYYCSWNKYLVHQTSASNLLPWKKKSRSAVFLNLTKWCNLLGISQEWHLDKCTSTKIQFKEQWTAAHLTVPGKQALVIWLYSSHICGDTWPMGFIRECTNFYSWLLAGWIPTHDIRASDVHCCDKRMNENSWDLSAVASWHQPAVSLPRFKGPHQDFSSLLQIIYYLHYC